MNFSKVIRVFPSTYKNMSWFVHETGFQTIESTGSWRGKTSNQEKPRRKASNFFHLICAVYIFTSTLKLTLCSFMWISFEGLLDFLMILLEFFYLQLNYWQFMLKLYKYDVNSIIFFKTYIMMLVYNVCSVILSLI